MRTLRWDTIPGTWGRLLAHNVALLQAVTKALLTDTAYTALFTILKSLVDWSNKKDSHHKAENYIDSGIRKFINSFK